MARLLSVNVGLPRDVLWKGRTVHTGIWKAPLPGRCRVRRLNLDGDGQGDRAGHGGEQRAVFVYQIEAHRHWQKELGWSESEPGKFGENFTVAGLPDDEVAIGDRFEIGSALFEISQPRVTCYRVGMRTDEPRMPALLTGSGRPGFYFRVLREGEVGAGDEIVKVGEAKERMTVAEVNALLYSSHHPRASLERALRIEALSPGWRWSFEALLKSGAASGNPGLAPSAAANPSAPGFRRLNVTAIQRESADVLSICLEDGHPLPAALPGQYVAVRLGPLLRCYSLSGPVSTERYRISVKIEPNGAGGRYVSQLHLGDGLEVSAPRGSFTLQSAATPVVLVSAGIGATPVLAMLHALAAERSTRAITWMHGARDAAHHPFAAEVQRLMAGLPAGRSRIFYSQPGAGDRYDAAGHLSFEGVAIPRDADVYVCGPDRFMKEMKAALAPSGARLHFELFQGSEGFTPGVVGAQTRPPHPPADQAATGALVSFARSGVVARWQPAYASLLELAEACDVPVRWSCRSGVCHSCESGLISGSVVYRPEPLDAPAAGNLLLCCSQPTGDVVVDM